MSDTQRYSRSATTRRLLRCPKCDAEIDSHASMCEYCGALVHVTGKGYTLALEGMICFSCGDANRWSAEGAHCRGCGLPFATTCPGCGEGVPLGRRLCQGCGLSVEDFAVERARVTVERHRERRDSERLMIAFARWQAFIGVVLMLAALLVSRVEPRARRPLLALGAAVTLTGFLPVVVSAHSARRRPKE
jgi:predicted amidophosphoribosyltransferase